MEYRNVPTTCIYCGAGCGLYLQVLDGKVVDVLPDKAHPISKGKLCAKGWNAHSFIYHEDRLSKPRIKANGKWREATWDEALDLTVTRLAEIRDAHGPDAIGILASAKCTNEENYLLQKLTRQILGTNNIDHCARL